MTKPNSVGVALELGSGLCCVRKHLKRPEEALNIKLKVFKSSRKSLQVSEVHVLRNALAYSYVDRSKCT